MNGELIVGILLFIVIFVLIGIVALAYSFSSRNTVPTTSVDINQGDLYNICFQNQCTGNLSCDGITGICKKNIGSTCSSSSDCAYPAYCSGVCVTGDHGKLNQNCPCDSNLTCVKSSSKYVCKLNGGQTCSSSSDCASLSCVNNICQTGFPKGYPCNNNSQCIIGDICSNGFCQNSQTPTGTVGSSCTTGCTNISGATCGNNQICKCTTSNSPGICVIADNGIYDNCNVDKLCSQFMNCYAPNGNLCGNNVGCICSTPYEDPNKVAISCINGMTESMGQCYNNAGLGCDLTLQCAGSCTDNNPSLVQIVFANASNFVGSDNMQIRRLNMLPTVSATQSNIQIFGTSIGDSDIIYAGGNGLWVNLKKNGSSQFSISEQLIVNTYNIGNRTATYICGCIYNDIAVNAITLLVAFREVGPDGDYYVLYTCPGANGPLPYSSFTPFNVTPGLGYPGTQRSSTGVLTVNNLSVSGTTSSVKNVMISTNNSGYLKKSTETIYSIPTTVSTHPELLTGVINKVIFYHDILRGEIDPIVCPPSNFNDKVLCPHENNYAYVKIGEDIKFSGSMSLYNGPTDVFNNVEYNVYDYSMASKGGILNGSGITLANASAHGQPIGNMAVLTYQGINLQIPYRVGNSFKCLTTANGYYIFSPSSCI